MPAFFFSYVAEFIFISVRVIEVGSNWMAV